MPNETLPQTVYALFEGVYSDKHLLGIFSTHVLAEDVKKLDRERYIQKFVLDELNTCLLEGLNEWAVYMHRDGEVTGAYNHGLTGPMHVALGHLYLYSGADKPVTYLCCTCWASSKEHAIKIANDMRTQIIVANNWHKDYVWKGSEHA